jgi:phage terminase large subunit-like protein
LQFIITTSGFDTSSPCKELDDYAAKVVGGDFENESFFALMYGIDENDDWTEFEVWKKANPNFGVSVGAEFLLTRQKDAMSSPRKAGVFKTKHLNTWVQSRAAYFNTQKYMAVADENLKLEDFLGQECIIGVDLAEKRDLTAIELMFRHKEGFACFGRYYAPEDTVEEPNNEHLRTWRDTGRLIQTDGAVTDQREIQADILEDLKRFDVREVTFDPWHSRQMSVELMEAGVHCVEFRNSPSNMNEPMRGMDALIAEGQMHHNGCQAFTWMLSNVVNGTRTSDLHRPAKERAENKIDGPVARMMALGRWLMDDAASTSPWDNEEFVLEVS